MTRAATPFNPLTIPIQGTNLIEASAGTGKTYGIAALFTRLVLLEHLSVEHILVVTFTKAATAELKNRLRGRLDEALRYLQAEADNTNERPQIDDFLQQLLQQARQKESLPRLILRLTAALSQFDNAAIFTIHGFCQRLLRDHALLCNTPFDITLSENNNKQLLIAAQNFWRERIAADPQAARLVFQTGLTPAGVLAQLKSYLARPMLAPRRPQTNLTAAMQHFEHLWQRVREQLPELEQTFWRVHPNLNGRSYVAQTYANIFAGLHAAAETGQAPSTEKLASFAASRLAEKIKKGKQPDAEAYACLNQLAELGEALSQKQAAETDQILILQLDMLVWLQAAVAEQKKSQPERTFDDLLTDVYHALTNAPQQQQLAQAVAADWQVALIDEFQDTDPLQYEIFRRIFITHNKPLFLVGDPKQAIYRFRGADIYAYLKAADDAGHHYTLTTNYRSHAELINNISSLFQQKQRPFVLADIDYAPVSAQRSESRLIPSLPAFQIRWLNAPDEAAPNKDILRQRAADYCADEIAGALNQAAAGQLDYRQGGQTRPLQSGDIAVLVRTHNEAALVNRALKARNVQCVLLQHDSVFAGAEAVALAALLGFWLQPQRIELLRFVLGSILFRRTAAEIYTLNHDETALQDYIEAAAAALACWQQQGIYAAMQQFAARYNLESNLLAAGQERSLTNYHQIIELLAEEDELSHSPSSLQQWLETQIQTAKEGASPESNMLRLESDDALVKIVTIHASKGLEYPLVYCPFLWNAVKTKPADWQILHRPQNADELLAKHQLDDDDLKQMADEELGENLRLLYVALTRAAERLVIYAAHCNDTAHNTFAYLLEGSPDSHRTAIEQSYQSEKAPGQLAMLYQNWQRFIKQQAEGPQPDWQEGAPQEARFHGHRTAGQQYQADSLPPRRFEWIRHTSFTGLTRNLAGHPPEHDELQPAIDPAETATLPVAAESADSNSSNPLSIHHFPRGTHAGVCLHELLETLDFQQAADGQSTFIADTLTRYGFETEWLPAVCQMLDHTARTPLHNLTSLADLPAAQRLPEMGFTLHMADFKLAELQNWLAQAPGLPANCIQAARRLDFGTIQGFLNGFIDMICLDHSGNPIVIDYKSNHLGNNSAAYNQAAMNEAMAEHHYYLQALIYAIATARYLISRGQTPETIRIRYLFLRGLGEGDRGVWQWNIPVDRLQNWL